MHIDVTVYLYRQISQIKHVLKVPLLCCLSYYKILKTYKDILKYLKIFSEWKSKSTKTCCINIHLNIALFVFNKYCKILNTTVTTIRLKDGTTNCNNANKIVSYKIIPNAIKYFVIF